MRLMLLIIAMVLGSFLLFSSFSRKKQKKSEALHDEFEQTILENSQNQNMLKRVENMQQEHNLDATYDTDSHARPRMQSPFVVSAAADPLLEELKKPAKLEVARFEMDEDEEDELNDLQDEEDDEVIEEKPKTYGFLALTIMPKANGQFSSIALQATLTRNHFRYGVQKLYHRHIQDNVSQPILYSVASIAKPGFFDQTSSQSYPGILIYLLLDDVQDPVNAFEKMLTSARQLSASLQAELCDAARQPITTALIQQYREKAKAAIRSHQREKEYQEW